MMHPIKEELLSSIFQSVPTASKQLLKKTWKEDFHQSTLD
jgi:hypothetical protein